MVRVGWRDQQHAALVVKVAGLQRVPGALELRADPLTSGPRERPSPQSSRGCVFWRTGRCSEPLASYGQAGARRDGALHGLGGEVGEKGGQEG